MMIVGFKVFIINFDLKNYFQNHFNCLCGKDNVTVFEGTLSIKYASTYIQL